MNVIVEASPGMKLEEIERKVRRILLTNFISRASGNLTKAAQLAGMNRTSFLKLVADFELNDYARGIRESVVDLRHKRSLPLARSGEPGVLAR